MSKHVKDKISLYIDGMLKDADLKAFEAHVKTCGECANVLAATKRAIAAAGKTKEEPLPVNFYAKLNQKLDAVEAKKDAFTWGLFMRGAVAVFTMLIVGVFVYNLKNQTKNFSTMTMKQDEQMPAQKPEAEVQGNAVPPKTLGVAPKPAGEEQGDYVMRDKIPDEALKPAVKKKAVAPAAKVQLEKASVFEGSRLKDKVYYDLANVVPSPGEIQGLETGKSLDQKEISANFYSEAPAQGKSVKSSLAFDSWAAKKPELKKAEASRAVKAAAAPAAKIQEASSASAGMAKGKAVLNESVADTAAAPMEEEASVGGAAEYYESGPQTFVFKSEKDWSAFAESNGIKETENIDWTRQMLVVVFPAGKPTAGYSIEITNVEYLADKVIVRYKETAPAKGLISADESAGSPVRAKAVNKSNLPVEFEESK